MDGIDGMDEDLSFPRKLPVFPKSEDHSTNIDWNNPCMGGCII